MSLPLMAGELHFQGEFIEGGLVIGLAEPGAQVRIDGEAVRVSPEGYFLVGFHREAPAETLLEVTYADGSSRQEKRAVAQREYVVQRIDGLPPKKVTPAKEDLERIRQEAELTAKARRLDDARTDFLGGFIWPAIGPISGVYGSQRVLNGEARQPHYGVDIARPVGTPVQAPAAGIVTLVHPDMYFSGGTMAIDHGHGLTSWFLHLAKILVREGQVVKQGEVVAEIGATGRVTGPHLDWRMNLFNKRIDPALLAPPMPAMPVETQEAKANGG